MKLGHKIKRLFIENVKRIRIVEVVPKGNVVEIAGRNAQGKSTVLDSIIYALGGKSVIPDKPIREGEKFATVVVETEEFTVTRNWTEDNKTYLKVAANTGKSPQSFLDEKINKISFDPISFARMEDKEQAKLLKQVAGINTVQLETQRATLYETRRMVGHDVKRLEVFRKELGEPVYDLPSDEVSTADLLDKINKISEAQDARNKLISKISSYNSEKTLALERIKLKEDEIRRIQKEIDTAKATMEVNDKRLEAMKVELDKIIAEDSTSLRGELKTIEETNRQIRLNQSISKAQNEWDDKRQEYDGYTAEIEGIDLQIKNMIVDAKYPIQGLAVKDDIIYFNDIPFKQASQAEQTKIGLAIAESLNPEFQVILIKDGSLLDKDSMKFVRDYAKEKDYQIWVERVEPDSEDAIIIEDGGVVSK